MMTGFWKLTWVEIKVFLRELLGVIGTLGIPVFLFLFLSNTMSDRMAEGRTFDAAADAVPFNVVILAALFIALARRTVPRGDHHDLS